MPTPIQILTDPLSMVIFAMYSIVILWEAFFPAKKLPRIRGWQLKGLISFMIYFFLSSYLPLWVDPILEPFRIFDLSGVHYILGWLGGLLLFEFGIYLWHFSMHRSDLLWRTFHQMHHSAERLDTFGAFFFSPLDMAGFTVLGSLCFSFIAGLPPQSITLILLSSTFFTIFQHANIRTPRWLGYFIQRPESHSFHHAVKNHRGNYSDLPIFDILFGTFHNPGDFHDTGFYTGASSRIVDMLLFKDVSSLENEAIFKSIPLRKAPDHVSK